MRPQLMTLTSMQFIELNEPALSNWWRKQSSTMANATNKKICERNRAALLNPVQQEEVVPVCAT